MLLYRRLHVWKVKLAQAPLDLVKRASLQTPTRDFSSPDADFWRESNRDNRCSEHRRNVDNRLLIHIAFALTPGSTTFSSWSHNGKVQKKMEVEV